MRLRWLLVGAIAVIVLGRSPVAEAYPQFQLARDQTCSACHRSPAGGGILSENGLINAEAISQFGTAPELFYGKLPLPMWLALAGDLRGAAGVDGGPDAHGVAFPMQAEVNAVATRDHFSLHVTAGLRDPQYRNTAKTLFATREHWLQWQQKPGETAGWFVRAGRFMPVFGLRFAEHPNYDRRFGGTPLYGEAYGLAVEYIHPSFEVHATGFIHDPLLPDSIERGNGATLYGELRIARTTSVGIEGKLDVTPDDTKTYGGVTAKHWFATPGILVETELEAVHQKLADRGGIDNQLVGILMGSYFVGPFMIDLAVDAYAPDVRVRYLDQEAVDLNVHWFATSHVELLVTNRLQMLELGAGGLTSGYSLLQLHYRL